MYVSPLQSIRKLSNFFFQYDCPLYYYLPTSLLFSLSLLSLSLFPLLPLPSRLVTWRTRFIHNIILQQISELCSITNKILQSNREGPEQGQGQGQGRVSRHVHGHHSHHGHHGGGGGAGGGYGQYPASRHLWVGNLASTVTHDQLHDRFQKYGSIHSS